jgi:hypothetical protein
MQRLAWNLAVSGALFLAAGYVVPVLRSWWYETIFQGHRFSTPFVWIDPAHALIWLFEFSWSLVAGLILGRLVASSHIVIWAFIFGILCGLLHFLGSHDAFGAGAYWSTYVWVYGQYMVPGLGAAAGAALMLWLWPPPKRVASKAA